MYDREKDDIAFDALRQDVYYKLFGFIINNLDAAIYKLERKKDYIYDLKLEYVRKKYPDIYDPGGRI